MSTTHQYWCFISYCHTDNQESGRQWATWLHQQLETYEVPEDLVGTLNKAGEKIPDRIFPVFRDEVELAVGADLSSPIYRALNLSRYMVVLCSPQSVESKYVADEIKYFKMTNNADHLMAVIIEGEPNASIDRANKELKECFPKALQHPVDSQGNLIDDQFTEPIAADFRLPDGGMGWTSPEAYRWALKEGGAWSKSDIEYEVKRYKGQSKQALLKIIARILGVPLSTLTKRDKAYQFEKERRRMKTFRRVVAVMSILLVISMITGIIAWKQLQDAQQHLAKIYLDKGNDCLINGLDYDGLLWITKALETNAELNQDKSLWIQVKSILGTGIPPEKVMPVSKEVLFSRISLDGRYILIVAKDWDFFLFDLETESFVIKTQRFTEKPSGASFSGDEQCFVIFSEHYFQVWDLANGKAWHDPVHLASIHPWMKTRIPSDAVILPEIEGIRVDTKTRDVLLALRGYEIWNPLFKDKGEIIPTHLLRYSCKEKNSLVIWELENEVSDPTNIPYFYNHGGGQFCIVLFDDGKEVVLHFYLDEQNRFKQMQTILDKYRVNIKWDMGPSQGSVFTFSLGGDVLPENDFDWGFYYPSNGSKPIAFNSRLIKQFSPRLNGLNVKHVAMNSNLMTLLYSVKNEAGDSDRLEYHLLMLAASEKKVSVLNHQTFLLDNDDDKIIALHPEGDHLAIYDRRICELTTYSVTTQKGLVETKHHKFSFLSDLKHNLYNLKYLPKKDGLLIYDDERLYYWQNGDLFGPYKCIPGIDPDTVTSYPLTKRIGVISNDAGVINLFNIDHTVPLLGNVYKKFDNTIIKDLRVDNKGEVRYIGLQQENLNDSDNRWQIFTGTGQSPAPIPVYTPKNYKILEDHWIRFVNDTCFKIEPESTFMHDALIINIPDHKDTDAAYREKNADMRFEWISKSGNLALRRTETIFPTYGSSERATVNLQAVINQDSQSCGWRKTFPAFSELIMNYRSEFFVLVGAGPFSYNSNNQGQIILASLKTGEILSQTELVLPAKIDINGMGTQFFLVSDRLLVLHCDYSQEGYYFFDPRTGKECAAPVTGGSSFDFMLTHSPDELYFSINNEERSKFEVVKMVWTDGKWQANAYTMKQPWTKAFMHPNHPVALVDQGVSNSNEEMVRLWDLEAMKPISKKFLINLKETDEFDALNKANGVLWSSDNSFIIIHTDHAVYLFNGQTGGLIKKLQIYTRQDNEVQKNIVTCMALSPNNEWVVSGSDNGTIQRTLIDSNAPIPLNRLKRQSAVFSGKYIDEQSELIPINWTTYAEKYNSYSTM